MVQKLSWLLVVSVICFCQSCYGSSDSSKEDDRAFGYELLQVQLDDMKKSQNQIAKEMTQAKDTAMETSNFILERQNSVMEKLLDGIITIANNTNQNKISSELAQMKISIEKQSSLMQQLLKIANNTNHILQTSISQQMHEIRSCKSAPSTGLYRLICLNYQTASAVYCEMDKFGGGWIVIQQRLDGSVNFTQDWTTYKHGFGNVGKSTEFWLGLEHIHQITNSGDYELAIELKDEQGKYGYARYSDFKIAAEKEKYQLSHLGGYSGTIGDQLSFHKDMKYSTFDQDNDESSITNCSNYWNSGGGWWYKKCAESVLNGAYIKNNKGYGIFWSSYTYAATFSRMMIRQK